jgi:hypothetical protein
VSKRLDGHDPAQLEELAAVTKEYATYSSKRSGLAGAAAGAWYIATFVIALRNETWGRIAGLWGPILIIGLLAAGRRYYQRFGRVLELSASPPPPKRWRSVGLVLLLTAITIMDATLNLDAWSDDSSLARWAIVSALAAAPAVPLLADRVIQGFWDWGILLCSLVSTNYLAMTHDRFGWVLAKLVLGLVALFGAVLVAVGIGHHLRYLRLERRLAAMRKRA